MGEALSGSSHNPVVQDGVLHLILNMVASRKLHSQVSLSTGKAKGKACAKLGLGNGLGKNSDTPAAAFLIRAIDNDRRISLIVIPDAQSF